MDTKKTAYLVVKIICKVCMSLNVALVTHFFNWNLIILNVFKSFFPFHFSVERGFHIFCRQSKSRLENKQQQRNTTSARHQHKAFLYMHSHDQPSQLLKPNTNTQLPVMDVKRVPCLESRIRGKQGS